MGEPDVRARREPLGALPLPHRSQLQLLVAVLGICVLVAFALHAVAPLLAGGFAALGFACAISLPILGAYARSAGKARDALRAGDYRVHWRYDAETWSQVVAPERFKTWLLAWLLPPLAGALGAFIAFVMLDSGQTVGGSALSTYLAVAGGSAAFALLGALLVAAGKGFTLRAMRSQPPQCVIGPEAIYFTGQLWTLRGDRHRLAAVDFLASPPRLSFRFVYRGPGTAAPGYLDLPVPAGHEEEARALVASLKEGLSSG